MGRNSTIRGQAIQPRIDILLDQGHSAQAIARVLASESDGPSASSIYRYAQQRRGSLAKHLAHEPNEMSVLARLSEAADSARVARRAALEGGSATALSKAITVEVGVLDKLSRQLGIYDGTFAEVAEEISGLLDGLRTLIQRDPSSAQSLADVLAESDNDQTQTLARSITAAIGASA